MGGFARAMAVTLSRPPARARRARPISAPIRIGQPAARRPRTASHVWLRGGNRAGRPV